MTNSGPRSIKLGLGHPGRLVDVQDLSGLSALGDERPQQPLDVLGDRLSARGPLLGVELGHPNAHLFVELHRGPSILEMKSVTKATDDVRKVIAEAGDSTRAVYAERVRTTTSALRADVERIFGGESPELLEKLAPVLESVGRKIGDQAFRQTDELLVKVSRQFDPAESTSPFAKQATALAR